MKERNVRPCKVGTMPELVQLFRGYKLRKGLIVKYRPLQVGHDLKWEPRDRHWSIGAVEEVSGRYFRLSRL